MLLKSSQDLPEAAGPRYTDFTSQYPSAVTIAASFDVDLVHKKAVLMGREFRGKGIGVVLGPVRSYSHRVLIL